MRKKNSVRSQVPAESAYAKVAISLPQRDLEMIDRLSERLSLTRSGVILHAVRHFFDHVKKQSQVEEYIKGYQRYPETETTLRVLEAIESGVLDHEDW